MTVAVNVTAVPRAAGVPLVVSAVVDVAVVTTCVYGALMLLLKASEPL